MKFGVMFDFRNPAQWRRPDPAVYRSHLDEIVRIEELGYHNVWLTEHHFVEDGYNPSVGTADGGCDSGPHQPHSYRDLCPSAAFS